MKDYNMILVIDNYDSFTYNIVEYLKQLNQKVIVKKNDQCSLEFVAKLNPERIVISPGPSNPKNSGICNQVIKKNFQVIPILGVCLGNQCLAYSFQAKIKIAKKIYHGKPTQIFHKRKGIFMGIPSPFQAIRYHSLVIDAKTLSKDFKILAKSEDGEIMAIQYKNYPAYGVQFHPESIGSSYGKELLTNFIKLKK